MERPQPSAEDIVSHIDRARNQFISDQLNTEQIKTQKGDRFDVYVGFVQDYAGYIGLPPSKKDPEIPTQIKELALERGFTSREFAGITVRAKNLYHDWIRYGRARYLGGRSITNRSQDPHFYYDAEHRNGLGETY